MVRETIAEASITALTADSSGISLGCAGRHDHGIGRVAFVLVDLAREESANVIDRGDLQYAPPLPTLVREVWMSAADNVAWSTRSCTGPHKCPRAKTARSSPVEVRATPASCRGRGPRKTRVPSAQTVSGSGSESDDGE